MAPSAEPAPTSVCTSSIKAMIWCDALSSRTIFFRRSSNSPRYLVPEIRLAISSETSLAFCSSSGTSPFAIASASASATAVLPTPGSPNNTGLFFVLRCKMVISRNSSSSRPMTGSSEPLRASSVRSVVYRSSVEVEASRAMDRHPAGSCATEIPVCRSSDGISASIFSITRRAVQLRQLTSAHSR